MSERDSKYPLYDKVMSIIKRLCKIQDFEPFQMLPPKSLKHYYKVIKNPTSLRSIRNNLRQYQSLRDVYKDFMLIVKNCQYYNQDGSVLFNCSEDLKKQIIKLFKRYELDEEMDYQRNHDSRYRAQVVEMVKQQRYRERMNEKSKKSRAPVRSSSRIRDNQDSDVSVVSFREVSRKKQTSRVKVKDLPKSVQNKQDRNKILNTGSTILNFFKAARKANKLGQLREFMKTVEETAMKDGVVKKYKQMDGVQYSVVLSRMENREMRKVLEAESKVGYDSDSFDDM